LLYINGFQVMSVNGQPYTAHGQQDTVLTPSTGEVVTQTLFVDFAGKFVCHCHILLHGNGEMMGVVVRVTG